METATKALFFHTTNKKTIVSAGNYSAKVHLYLAYNCNFN